MKVLIVEDMNEKKDQIIQVLKEVGIDKGDTHTVGSLIEAKKELLNNCYTVMILDLILPDRDGEYMLREDAGLELLRELYDMRNYKIPNHIFVLSESEEALERLTRYTAKISCTLVKYQGDSQEWTSNIKSLIGGVLRNEADGSQYSYKFDMAIICALDEPELDQVLKMPWLSVNTTAFPGDHIKYYICEYEGKRVLCASAYEMGMPAASILATKIVCLHRPKYLAMTGIAAGVDRRKVKYGDIMVADPCFDYGSGKRTVNIFGKKVFKPNYRQRRLDEALVQIVKELCENDSFKQDMRNEAQKLFYQDEIPQIHIGAFGSGAAVLQDRSVVDEMLSHERKLLGFDMEAYGVMLAAQLSGNPFPRKGSKFPVCD